MGHINNRAVVIDGKKFVTPFNLELEGRDALLECIELIRLVPGKRAVLLSRWRGKLVVAKLFYLKFFGTRKSVEMELVGNRLLESANIATAEIVYNGSANKDRLKVVLFDYIHPSKKLSDVLFLHQGSNQYREYLKKLIILISRFHEAGLLHNDLHLDNFLVKKDILYAIDGSSVKKLKMGAPLDTKTSLKNLAIIFAQLNIQDQDLLMEIINVYFANRNWKNKVASISFLRRDIDKRRKLVTNRHLKKIYRESTKTVCKKSFTSFTLCKRDSYTPGMAAFLENPDDAFESPETTMLKNGNSTTVVRLTVDGLDLVVKRYNAKNHLRGFRHAFKKSYADRSWRSAHFLMRNGIKTASPIAMKEMRFGIFRRRSYLVCEYVDGISAFEYFKKPEVEGKKDLTQQIVGILKQLNFLLVRHGDMKASNILIHNRTPYLIDLDSMVVYKNKILFANAHHKDVARFMKNWAAHPKIADQFRTLL